MATNLKHSPQGLMEAFEHHLVYEVNMLRHTFAFLHVRAWSTELRNAIIETFCVHARNLVGFFDEEALQHRVSPEAIMSVLGIFAEMPISRGAKGGRAMS